MTRIATTSSIAAAGDSLLAELMERLTEKLANGDGSAAVEAILLEHPAEAERLRRIMPTLQVLAMLDSGSSVGRASRRPCLPTLNLEPGTWNSPLPTLGDYRILREIGRGGMGIVYEADQISLRRRVALKVLPLAGMLDERALARFKNEAQAAAGLHHPNIVPIYAVGCDRCVHYYAMQLIDGQPLDRVIAAVGDREGEAPAEPLSENLKSKIQNLKSDSRFRLIAELGIQAAEALHYAHDLGIIHRDIKPANLLLENPPPSSHHSPLTTHDSPHLYITDFGLARIAGADNLTMSGDLLGTLRYMSPEQALGSPTSIDHRTDIYSLGATLYELLTGQPVITGSDRAHILRQITTTDPLLPRRLNPRIPRDLETILLKALSKDPTDRYSAANEIADDLQRFLENRPINAYRAKLSRRMAIWSRRHAPILLASSSGLAVAAFVAIIAAILLWHESGRTTQAMAEVKVRAREAEQGRQQVEANFRKAMDGVGYVRGPLYRPEWAHEPLVAEMRRAQAEQAVMFFRAFLRDNDSDPDIRLQTAIAYMHLGGAHAEQKDVQGAAQYFQEAIGLFDKLVADDSRRPLYRIELAQALFIFGIHQWDEGFLDVAAGLFNRAKEHYLAAHRLAPRDSRIVHLVAWVHATCPDPQFRDSAYALACAKTAAEMAPDNGMMFTTLGVAHCRNADYASAVSALEKSMELHQGGDSLTWFFLAVAHARLGHYEEAQKWYDKGTIWRMEKNRVGDFDLRSARSEADAALKSNGSHAKQGTSE